MVPESTEAVEQRPGERLPAGGDGPETDAGGRQLQGGEQGEQRDLGTELSGSHIHCSALWWGTLDLPQVLDLASSEATEGFEQSSDTT